MLDGIVEPAVFGRILWSTKPAQICSFPIYAGKHSAVSRRRTRTDRQTERAKRPRKPNLTLLQSHLLGLSLSFSLSVTGPRRPGEEKLNKRIELHLFSRLFLLLVVAGRSRASILKYAGLFSEVLISL